MRLEASHLLDDRLLRRVHIERLRSAHAHSQQSAGRPHHLLQPSEVLEADEAGNVYRLRTPFLYTELRAGRTVTLKLKTPDFRQRTRSQSIAAPTQLAGKIFAICKEMLARETDGEIVNARVKELLGAAKS